MATPEGKIQKEVLNYLKRNGVFCWRNNNMPTYDPKIGQYRAFDGLKGVPDIVGILPDGRFLGVEVKTPRGKQSPEQVLFERRSASLGAVYILARNVEDVKDHGVLQEKGI